MSTLFSLNETATNLLPIDGEVFYFGKIFTEIDSANFYTKLLNEIDWKNDQALIFGKLITTKRKVAWYAENEFEYTYSKITKVAKVFNELLLELKDIAEKHTGSTYNSCLLNLYNSGNEGMAYHSDGEKDLKKHGSIASFSFGAERNFLFKHKRTLETISVFLENGSLLEMKDQTQDFWLHRLPTSTKIKTPRINLTFRTIDK